MPNVAGEKYPYTKKGMADAANAKAQQMAKANAASTEIVESPKTCVGFLISEPSLAMFLTCIVMCSMIVGIVLGYQMKKWKES